jgi:O-antigen/teichoic acid export membrane protein
MSQARTIFKNTSLLAGARVIERASGLLLALFISRELGAAGLGIYATATAYFSLIAIAGASGTTNLLIREIAKDRARTNAYVVHASVLASAVSLVAIGVAWEVIPHLGYSHELETALRLIVLAIVPATLNTIQEAVFVAHQRVEFETATTLFASATTVGVSVYLLASGHGVGSLIGTFVAVEYAVTLVYFVLINRYIVRLRLVLRRSFALRLVREIRAFAAMSLLAGVFARPEVIVLSLIGTEAQVGFYSAALKIVDLWLFIPETYGTNVFPVLSRSFHLGDGRAQAIQDLALKYLLALALPLTAGLAAAAGPIVAVFYGSGFHSSVLLLRILALNVTAVSIWAVLWRVLAARGDQGTVLRAQVLTIGIRLVAGIALIAWLDALGAALATTASLAFYSAVLVLWVRHDGTRVRLVRLGWRFGAAALLMGILVALVASRLDLWALVLIAGAIYASLVLVLRAFAPDDVARFRSLLPTKSVRPHPLG